VMFDCHPGWRGLRLYKRRCKCIQWLQFDAWSGLAFILAVVAPQCPIAHIFIATPFFLRRRDLPWCQLQYVCTYNMR
jgi:hypothetical protein